jgi:hypothetical protein
LKPGLTDRLVVGCNVTLILTLRLHNWEHSEGERLFTSPSTSSLTSTLTLKKLEDCEGDFGFDDTSNNLTLKTRVVGVAVVVVDCDILKFVRWQPCSRSDNNKRQFSSPARFLNLVRNSTYETEIFHGSKM